MDDQAGVRLRPSGPNDLEFICSLEGRPEYRGLIGHWVAEEHLDALHRPDREHWIIERLPEAAPVGYLIAYDLRSHGFGMYLKRITVATPSVGIGRQALGLFLTHSFDELGADTVWLDVYRSNERAQRAYAAVGFTVVDAAAFDRTLADKLIGPNPPDCLLMRIRAQQ
jgi:RimJ/RimL family protein N-acetyltransferase